MEISVEICGTNIHDLILFVFYLDQSFKFLFFVCVCIGQPDKKQSDFIGVFGWSSVHPYVDANRR
jgi:hypothetical protein